MKYEIRYIHRVDNIFKTKVEGVYKTKLIANRHTRKLKRKYPNVEFKIKELMGG